MSYYGFNFRATSGFVTDGAGDSPVLGESYPTTYSNGVTAGFETGGDTVTTRDRNNSYNSHIAGSIYCSDNGGDALQQIFRIDLTTTGSYTLNLALGDESYAYASYLSVYDTSSLLSTLFNGYAGALNSFCDAAGNNYYPGPNWVAGNVPVSLTFSTTIARFYIGNTTTQTPINYIGLTYTGVPPWSAAPTCDFSLFPRKIPFSQKYKQLIISR